MRVALGSDHAGLTLKDLLRRALADAGHDVDDVGTHSAESTDYPDWAAEVGHRVADGRAERGVLVCGTGVGMAMAANKVRGVRAANCNNLYTTELARRHNDANVLTLGAREVGPEHAVAILVAFLAAPFEGGRHGRRVEKISRLEGTAG